MAILSFLTQLAGATLLLLFAVRMVRNGIERAYGPSFRRVMTGTRNPIGAAIVGVVMAMVLQSSAAVALLTAGFAGTGGLGFGAGLAMIIGADLGSALLIQVLSLSLDWLVPVLLTIGGLLFLKSSNRVRKQVGRMILGIAFILIALRFLRETMDPIRDSAFLPAIAGYLARDYVTAFLAGAALAFAMHSSVATILMCVTVVAIGALPVQAGVSLVLGANCGSALIPVWLSRGGDPPVIRLPYANLLIRGSGAALAVVLVNELDLLALMPPMPEGQILITLHIAFNTALLLALPFCALLENPMKALIPDTPEASEAAPLHHRSVLDKRALGSTQHALSALRREVMRMTHVLQEMLEPAMTLYSDHDAARVRAIRALDQVLNSALDDIRQFSADLPSAEMSKPARRELRELTEHAIALEAAGDIVVKRLTVLATEKAENALALSSQGLSELTAMHERVVGNLALAANVVVSDDVDSARLLMEEKKEMAQLHRATRKKHLKRVIDGNAVSLASSDVHLETATALKELNSQIATLAYPLLHREGQLLDSRLVSSLSDD